jgi:hypothetical protein
MIILITFAPGKNFRNMIQNTDKRRAGGVPASIDGTAAAGTLCAILAKIAWKNLYKQDLKK